MPRTALTPVNVPGNYSNTLTAFAFVALDAANGNSFSLTGDQLLLLHNTGAGARTVTITSVADERGRVAHITAESIPAGEYRVCPKFPVIGYRQTDGKLWVTGSHAELEAAVLNLATAR